MARTDYTPTEQALLGITRIEDDPTEGEEGDRLAALRHLNAVRLQAAYRIERVVADARKEEPPIAWSEIGYALGVSKQAAQKRYGAEARESQVHDAVESFLERSSSAQ